MFYDIECGSGYMNMKQARKVKIGKLDYIKIKNFYKSHNTINRVKKPHMQWKKNATYNS